MLKNISPIISPELLKILMEMGHGDEIVIGDGNFPAASNAQRLVRLDGHGVDEILAAILKLMPLDTYVEAPVALMDNGDAWSVDPFEKKESSFFNGHILIVAQAGTEKGACNIQIDVEGFETKYIALNLE